MRVSPFSDTRKKRDKKIQLFFYLFNFGSSLASAETDLGQNALACQKFRAQANHEAKHGQTSIPLLSERRKAEFGVAHLLLRNL